MYAIMSLWGQGKGADISNLENKTVRLKKVRTAYICNVLQLIVSHRGAS